MEEQSESSTSETKEDLDEAIVEPKYACNNEKENSDAEEEGEMEESIQEAVTLVKIEGIESTEGGTSQFEEALLVPEVDNETEVLSDQPDEEFVQVNQESDNHDSITIAESPADKVDNTCDYEVNDEVEQDELTVIPSAVFTLELPEDCEKELDTTTSDKQSNSKASDWSEDGGGIAFCGTLPPFITHFRQTLKAPFAFQKQHNLSVSELRRKLAFCPICQTQHNSHKTANSCLARHGKRQCWLCLDILSSKKDEFYRHCMDFHSISNTGDIVGCPFCGKCFDFRQGLNQHIVKIHFAENIADMESVAALSPATLVDIFTGKPRASPSASQYQQQLQLVAPDQLPESTPVAADNNNEGMHVTEESFTLSESNIPGDPTALNKEIIANPIYTEIPSEIAHSVSRPSVITQLLHTAQKMNVPAEQTLSSLTSEIESSLVSNYCQFSQRSLQEKDNMTAVPSKVEIMENPSVQFQKYVDLFPYTKVASPLSLPLIVTSDPEKFDPANFSLLLPNKDASQECLPKVDLGESGYGSYEQVITRVHRNTPQQLQNESNPIISQSSISSPSNNQQATEQPETLADLGEAAIYGSLGSILKTADDLDLGDGKSFDNLNNLSSPGKIQTPTPSNYEKNEATVNQEIGLSCNPPKISPDNCGVKRRILMKMWDERQCKKPPTTIAPTHALVHDLHAAAAHFSLPAPLKKTMTFNRGYCEDGPLATNSQQQGRVGNMAPVFSQYPKQNAGPFFEQYVQDPNRQENPLKILDLARVPAPAPIINRANIPKPRMESIAASWNAPVQHKSPANFGSQCQYSHSCALQEAMMASRVQQGLPITPQNISIRQRLPQPVNNLQFPGVDITRVNLRGRRPPNPAFWDGLRARLMMAQNAGNMQYRDVSTIPGNYQRRYYQTNTPTFADCRFSQPARPESIVVQNPFEEVTTYQSSELNTPTTTTSAVMSDYDSEGFRIPGTQNIVSLQKRPPSLRELAAAGSPTVPFASIAQAYMEQTNAGNFQQGSGAGMPRNINPNYSQPLQITRQNMGMNRRFPLLQQQLTTPLPRSHPLQRERGEAPMSQEASKNASTYSTVYSPRYGKGHYRFLNQLRSVDKSKACE